MFFCIAAVQFYCFADSFVSDISFIIDVVGSIWYYDKDFADYAAVRKDKNAAAWIMKT